MKAVPTEWNGIRFRSKSEACFAMYLTHHGRQWEYEPEELTLDCGYVPDFRVMWYNKSTRKFYCELIEYKPADATDTYMKATLEKLAILSNHVAMECHPHVMTGSFWENDECHTPKSCQLIRGELRWCYSWSHFDSEPDEWELRQKISQHRFDLVSELSKWKGHLV